MAHDRQVRPLSAPDARAGFHAVTSCPPPSQKSGHFTCCRERTDLVLLHPGGASAEDSGAALTAPGLARRLLSHRAGEQLSPPTRKEDHVTQDIPVIVCFWLEEEAQALTEGVASYLQKPILYRDVLTALTDVGARAP